MSVTWVKNSFCFVLFFCRRRRSGNKCALCCFKNDLCAKSVKDASSQVHTAVRIQGIVPTNELTSGRRRTAWSCPDRTWQGSRRDEIEETRELICGFVGLRGKWRVLELRYTVSHIHILSMKKKSYQHPVRPSDHSLKQQNITLNMLTGRFCFFAKLPLQLGWFYILYLHFSVA